MADEDERLRADARANRDRILEVARVALAADPDASLHSIARTAGVGQGTLYRHFATREALVLSVYRREIDALVELAPALLAEHPPLRAFRTWCDRFAQAGRRKHGMAAVIDAEDVLQLLGCTIQIPPTPGGEARIRRLHALVFRGLGARDGADMEAAGMGGHRVRSGQEGPPRPD